MIDDEAYYWLSSAFYVQNKEEEEVKKEYGCNCLSCKEFFPYAEKINNFKCYYCKNYG